MLDAVDVTEKHVILILTHLQGALTPPLPRGGAAAAAAPAPWTQG